MPNYPSNFIPSRRFACAVALLTLSCLTSRADAADEVAAMKYEKDIRPLLDAACFRCHKPEKKKGKIDLTKFTDDQSALKDRKLWRKAIEQIETLEMPPAEERQLTPPEREVLLKWMRRTANTVDCNDPADRNPGPALVRRLNRAEYDLTIRDLLGIEFNSGDAVGMPDDTPVHGFANLVNGLILPPALMEKYFGAADQILDQVLGATDGGPVNFKSGEAKKKAKTAGETFLMAKAVAGLAPRDAARKVMERFTRLAYRRPLREGEIDRLLKLFDLASAKGEKYENAVRLMAKAVLVSPHFLFRVERDRAPAGSDDIYRVDDHELAVRLSYFLWSSMPDAKLFELAEAGKLSDPAELEPQVKRMLADPKAKAMTDNFAAQWLQTAKVEVARPSTEFFPTFTPKLREAMRDETTLFFDNLRREDRSILDLLDADYTFANADLAKHYGIAGVEGKEMRRVALKPEHHRGGLLGMGSVLALTSHTNRTSPTLRGKYVLEVIFGTPPAPPPPDAGALPEQSKKKGEAPKTFREQMAQHATQASCAACHKKIDPLGYAMENFDAVGAWRDNAGGRPLDNTGQLPTGEKFAGPGELKQVILSRKAEFTRNVTEQMLTYALGREMQYYDECPTREITAGLEGEGHKFSALVLGVVKSYPFLHRRNTDAAEGHARAE